uniref:mannose-6-phosphate isomerase n=1 Tax=Acrobeloides nanus TaxID=290746 RepID=A0A914E7H7_9BILA
MFKLECAVQNYAWGRVGLNSTVAKLHGGDVDQKKPYAELWMGAHSNGPSKLVESGISLADYIRDHPESLGQHEQGSLQFLFKVLSVETALSIQSHPTKEQAKILHKNDPKNYPDDNHKPEMAIALTDFELLCGFRVPHEIISNFKAHQELLDLIDEHQLEKLASDHEDEHKGALKNIFAEIMNSSHDKIKEIIDAIIERISKKETRPEVEELMLRLNSQYPGGDIGVLAPFLLNYFTLKPGEATFLGPNEPHAYLYGDCVECMACSDNTIRAGLTPKFKDVPTLVANLTYQMTAPPYFRPKEIALGITEYAPPVPEFTVQKIGPEAKTLPNVKASSILIVIQGMAVLRTDDATSLVLKSGDVVFISASVHETTVESDTDDFLAFRAFTPYKA